MTIFIIFPPIRAIASVTVLLMSNGSFKKAKTKRTHREGSTRDEITSSQRRLRGTECTQTKHKTPRLFRF